MPSRRHTYTFLSALYLLALTILAAWALHRKQIHSLPIPTALGGFTLALPAIVGLALESLTGTTSPSSSPIRWAPSLRAPASVSSFGITFLFIFETALATLAGTYLSPVDSLNCGLDTRWRSLYHNKAGSSISQIQHAFQCCGLHSALDMAYPFPGDGRGADACKVAYGWESSCFEAWRKDERVVAGVMLAVVVGTAVWKVLVIYMQARYASWASEGAVREDERRALEYHGAEEVYRDQPDVEDVQEEDMVPALRVIPSRLRDDDEL